MLPSFPLLAIDTSSRAGYVALWKDRHQCVAHKIHEVDSHNEKLAEVVDRACSELSLSAKQIRSVFFGGGPGSFTGLRIGASFVIGLLIGADSLPSDTPVLYVSQSLEVFARGLLHAIPALPDVLIAADARRDEVYAFALSADGQIVVPLGIYPAHPRPGACTVPSGGEPHDPANFSADQFLHGVLATLEAQPSSVKPYGINELAQLELHYLREVAAKTIAERSSGKAPGSVS